MQNLKTVMSTDAGWKSIITNHAELGIQTLSPPVITTPSIPSSPPVNDDTSDEDDKKKKLGIGLGVGLGVGIPCVVAVAAFFVMRRKDQNVQPQAQAN